MPADNYKATPPALSKLFPGVDVRLDLDMTITPSSTMPDRSTYGANATINVGTGRFPVVQAPGVFDQSAGFIPNSASVYSGSLLSYSAAHNITGDMTSALWVKFQSAGDSYIQVRVDAGSAWQWGLYGLFNSTNFYTPGTGWGLGGADSGVLNTWKHIAASCKGAIGRVFIDGLQRYRAAYVSGAASSGGATRYHTNATASELIDQPIICAQALSPEQIYRLYQAASARPLFYDNFSQYPVDFAAKAAGAECGPFRIVSGTHQITVDATGKKWVQCVTAGAGYYKAPDPTAYGTWEWDFYYSTGTDNWFMPIASISGAYNAAGQNGYAIDAMNLGALAIYRWTGGALGASVFTTANGFLVAATPYTVRLVRRIGGQCSLYIKGGAYPDFVLATASGGTTNPATDNTYTTGGFANFFLNLAGFKQSNIKQWLTCRRPSSFPWEFSTGTYSGVVSSSKVWKNQLTAGITYLPKDYDYLQGRSGFRTMKNWIYKGAAGSILDTIFGEELLGSAVATQYGYVSRIRADGTVDFIRTANGVETIITSTAAGFIADTTEYERRITRSDAGRWIVSFKGGAYADWTVATDVVGMIYQTANYLLSDFDVGDRETAPYFSDGVES